MRSRTLLAGLAVLSVGFATVVRAADPPHAVRHDPQVSRPDPEAVRWASAVLRAHPTSAAPARVQPVVRAQDAAVPAAPAAPEPGNLWTFLGFPNKKELAAHKEAISRMPLHKLLKGATEPPMKLLGLVPGPPPLEAPENLAADVPALQAAAKIKEEENLVPAKIQAIRYLGKIGAKAGCVCYPDVKTGLLAALKDCNEKVRREAVKAIEKTNCCDPEMLEKLADLAHGTDDYGRPKEPSAKVRKAALKALESCACDVPIVPEEEIREEIEPEIRPEDVAPSPEIESDAPTVDRQAFLQPSDEPVLKPRYLEQRSDWLGRRHRPAERNHVAAAFAQRPSQVERQVARPVTPRRSRGRGASSGAVTHVDLQSGLVSLHFDGAASAVPGARYRVFHKYPFQLAHIGDVEIVDTANGGATARPIGQRTLRKISKGDEILLQQ